MTDGRVKHHSKEHLMKSTENWYDYKKQKSLSDDIRDICRSLDDMRKRRVKGGKR